MAGVETDGLGAYFKSARTYDQDRVLKAERSKRTAWIVAGSPITLFDGFAITAIDGRAG